ncbi:hypothetical protein OUZ56_012838 [Daphnia magna]|uniref:Uncharacterized protein n=1 Tax=Daphnia magna TaxID=35525 RepID=A0ABQ9Z4B6_9CRUS|nr:hypothetical protein OUZ56_012838 [Daphnia magna]
MSGREVVAKFVACNHAIIKVNDNYRDFVSDMTKVYTGISFTSHNTEYEYEFVEFLVPFVRCLLKPVEGLKKLTDVVLFSFHHEPLRLLHLDGFFMFGVQKCSFDIELCQFKIHGWCLGKEDFDCTLFRDGSECFVEVSILYCCRDSTTEIVFFFDGLFPVFRVFGQHELFIALRFIWFYKKSRRPLKRYFFIVRHPVNHFYKTSLPGKKLEAIRAADTIIYGKLWFNGRLDIDRHKCRQFVPMLAVIASLFQLVLRTRALCCFAVRLHFHKFCISAGNGFSRLVVPEQAVF